MPAANPVSSSRQCAAEPGPSARSHSHQPGVEGSSVNLPRDAGSVRFLQPPLCVRWGGTRGLLSECWHTIPAWSCSVSSYSGINISLTGILKGDRKMTGVT